MLRALLYFFICVLAWSCANKQDCDKTTTHISGEVVNPTSDYIYFFYNSTQLDSIPLDSNNRFSFTNDNLKEGLYNFRHNEIQTFYVVPGDSIVFRVNTIDFDESLHFSGSGEKRNNLLTQLFLNTEKANNAIKLFYDLPPEIYLEKIDSLNSLNKSLVEEFNTKNALEPKAFKKIANANVDFANFLHKELYISNLIRNSEKPIDIVEQIPESFLSHRKTVDYNNTDLQLYFPYYRYLNLYFDNIAYENYDNPLVFDRKEYEHSKHKLKAIDEKIKSGDIRNLLLKNTTSVYLANTKNEKEEQDILTQFLSLNNDPSHHTEVKKLAELSLNHIPGKIVPNLQLVNTDNEMLAVHDIITKPCVLYFWSYASIKTNKDLHMKARELASKYPEYDFIGINTDTNFRKWRNTVTNFKYNTVKEYQLEDKISSYQQLHINSNGKAIIVHKDKTIIQGNTALNSFEIENELLGFLNL